MTGYPGDRCFRILRAYAQGNRAFGGTPVCSGISDKYAPHFCRTIMFFHIPVINIRYCEVYELTVMQIRDPGRKWGYLTCRLKGRGNESVQHL